MPPITLPPTSPISTRRAEALLKRIGFNPGKVDDVESAATKSAVMEFQTAWGLSATGLVDDATAKKLQTTVDRVKKHAKAKDLSVSVGEKSKDIATLEKRLRALGYNPGKADGIYGRDTAEAVK